MWVVAPTTTRRGSSCAARWARWTRARHVPPRRSPRALAHPSGKLSSILLGRLTHYLHHRYLAKVLHCNQYWFWKRNVLFSFILLPGNYSITGVPGSTFVIAQHMVTPARIFSSSRWLLERGVEGGISAGRCWRRRATEGLPSQA